MKGYLLNISKDYSNYFLQKEGRGNNIEISLLEKKSVWCFKDRIELEPLLLFSTPPKVSKFLGCSMTCSFPYNELCKRP